MGGSEGPLATGGGQGSGRLQVEERLDTWKEIAAYLGRDVRTVIRWADNGGMPVYRGVKGKRGTVYAFRAEIDEWIRSDCSDSLQTTRPRSSRMVVLVGIGAVFVLILVGASLLLRLNSFLDTPGAPVEERPWVLITDFDNRSGEDRFDGTVETALRRELANSRHLLVVPPERIANTLALMKEAPDMTIDAVLGREICLRYGGIRALLTGRVESFGSTYLLSLEVVDPADGRTVASVEEEAPGEAEVLPAVHRLSDWLRESLGEKLARIRRNEDPLEKVTTPSLRALELYSKGMRVFRGRFGPGKMAEAESLFRQALEEDTEFASANVLAFWSMYHQGKSSEDEARSFLERAFELAGSTSDQERYFIEGTYYDLIERDYEKACQIYGTLADFFPDHPWAAGNAAFNCGSRLGKREGYLRWAQAVDVWPGWTGLAAESLTFLEADFDRARPYVDLMRTAIADGDVLLEEFGGTTAVVFTEFFSAEEHLEMKRFSEVLSELRRVESARDSMNSSLLESITQRLVCFHLALGRFREAQRLAQETGYRTPIRSWSAFLAGDQTAFEGHLQDFIRRQLESFPDPRTRLSHYIGLYTPLGVLIPTLDPECAMRVTALADTPDPLFSGPEENARLTLVRGRQMLAEGHLEEARVLLTRSRNWFRDYGDWAAFSNYFMSVELLTDLLIEQKELLAARQVLHDAARQRKMVWSYTGPLYQRVLASLAFVDRELGHIAEAEAIESELEQTLSLADQDHPILVQIREQREVLMKIE
ncbi:MAG: helix-turn-helix domain-containing protein [Acidobacteriota bacterium]|nr:MAG: helix-turn-helix domain-containing protein [Acidobacteriota bacterium]